MCGRFAQYDIPELYLEALNSGLNAELNGHFEPIGRYNISPGTNVLIINQRSDIVFVDGVHWGYQPSWAKDMHRQAMINARVESAATGKMFKPLWERGRALVPANGWYEWKSAGGKAKQPFYITQRSDKPMFFAAISKQYPEKLEKPEDEGFVIVTAQSDKGLVDIHDRRLLVMDISASNEWLDPDTSPERAEELSRTRILPASEFMYWPVSLAVGNVKNNGPELITPLNPS